MSEAVPCSLLPQAGQDICQKLSGYLSAAVRLVSISVSSCQVGQDICQLLSGWSVYLSAAVRLVSISVSSCQVKPSPVLFAVFSGFDGGCLHTLVLILVILFTTF